MWCCAQVNMSARSARMMENSCQSVWRRRHSEVAVLAAAHLPEVVNFSFCWEPKAKAPAGTCRRSAG